MYPAGRVEDLDWNYPEHDRASLQMWSDAGRRYTGIGNLEGGAPALAKWRAEAAPGRYRINLFDGGAPAAGARGTQASKVFHVTGAEAGAPVAPSGAEIAVPISDRRQEATAFSAAIGLAKDVIGSYPQALGALTDTIGDQAEARRDAERRATRADRRLNKARRRIDKLRARISELEAAAAGDSNSDANRREMWRLAELLLHSQISGGADPASVASILDALPVAQHEQALIVAGKLLGDPESGPDRLKLARIAVALIVQINSQDQGALITALTDAGLGALAAGLAGFGGG